MAKNVKKYDGVNLGGWLVLEKWMTPSVFGSSSAVDEYNFCLNNRSDNLKRLKKHRATFMTEEDFEWIHQHGYNAIRLPVGYWAIGGSYPYISATAYVDFVFKMSKKYTIKVLLQLHAAPGSQNDKDHSGQEGTINWPLKLNQKKTLKALKALAQRYGQKKSLLGIGLLNEPSPMIPKATLTTFYMQCFQQLPGLLHPGVYIIINTQFMPIRAIFSIPRSSKLMFDNHYYFVHSHQDLTRGIWWHYLKLAGRYLTLQLLLIKCPVIVGEYTHRLPDKIASKQYRINWLQDLIYSQSKGAFYWSYKTETHDAWSLRTSL